jgi:hypothetical protein
MILDRSEFILKALATQYLSFAVQNLHLSIRSAVGFEKSTTDRERNVHAQHALYHQFLALEADEIARMSGIDTDDMNKFMHQFFATDIDWSQI